MRRHPTLAAPLLATCLLAACRPAPADTADSAASSCNDPYVATWGGWGDGFFAGYCRSCHSADSPDRHDAPADVNFDTRAEVDTFASSIRRAVLEQETMPIGGGVSDDDRVLLDVFLDCEAAR